METLAASSSSGSSSSSSSAGSSGRSPASSSATPARKIDFGSVKTEKSNSALKPRDGLRPGERIVEEIDLTKQDQPGRTRDIRRQPSSASGSQRLPNFAPPRGSTTPSGSPQATQNNPQLGGTDGGGEGLIAAPAGGGGEVGGRRGGGSGVAGGGGRPSTRATNRGPAAAGPAENATSNEVAPSSFQVEQVVSSVTQADYSYAKSRLRQPSFQEQLRKADITVVDMIGNQYGASKGKIILLDTGDRFVRRK